MRLYTFIIFTLLCVVLLPSAKAQRTISELESNMDTDMALQKDTTRGQKPKVVPNDIRSWVIDEVYGNISPTDVDTLMYLFYNDNLSEGRTGHYNTLSNLGSPRQSRIFSERASSPQFIFTEPMDQFFVTTDRFKHYNTKSPFMNITYNNCGTKQTGDDHIKVIYTNNAGKKLNIGAIYDYMYGQGFYSDQNTSFMNASGWASYISDKYNFHFYYQHNFMKMAENGGIIDERDITHPEAQKFQYASNDIPVYLSQTWNRQEHDIFFFNHHFNIGFYKKEQIDSTKTNEIFVPVAKLFHTVKFQNMRRHYKSYRETPGYHQHTYLPGDSTNDWTKHKSIRNHIGLSLCEGFNKWSVCGLSAYIGHEYRQFSLIDKQYGDVVSPYTTKYYRENNVFVGGQIIRQQGTTLHFNVNAEFGLVGQEATAYDINGHGELLFPFLKDTAQFEINAYIKQVNPSFYYRHYHSKHAWWDNDNLHKESRQRVEGIITIPSTKSKLKGSLENITNYVYFANNGGLIGKDSIANNTIAKQETGSIQVYSLGLEQNFKFGILHFDNEIVFQHSSNDEVLPLPKLSTFHNLYLDFRIAKVLHTQIGADMKYFTEYYAPDYSPVIGSFTTQNNLKKVKIGNYPLISIYANFALKRTRFYVHYYHANQKTGRYFWAPGYPMNPTVLRTGLSWNFFD